MANLNTIVLGVACGAIGLIVTIALAFHSNTRGDIDVLYKLVSGNSIQISRHDAEIDAIQEGSDKISSVLISLNESIHKLNTAVAQLRIEIQNLKDG